MGFPRGDGLPQYRVIQTGITELNVSIRRANKKRKESDYAPIIEAMELLGIKGIETRMNDHGPDLPPSMHYDLKFGIPNGLLPETIQHLKRIHADLVFEQKKSLDDPEAGLWAFCTFNCEDELQTYTLQSNSVPEANFDTDCNMGSFEKVPMIVVKMVTSGGEEAYHIFIARHWETLGEAKARAAKWLTQAVTEDLKDSYAKADWEEFETYGPQFLWEKLKEDGGDYEFIEPQAHSVL